MAGTTRPRENSTAPDVSVVIPVRNDTDRLLTCVDAIAQQTIDAEVEVIVVDNGSDRLPDEVTERHDEVQLLEEPQPGSYAARNRGIEEARGSVLAFTDADCVPAPDWLERGVQTLRDNPESFVGGNVKVFPRPEVSQPSPAELFDLAQGLRQDIYIERHGFALTANLLVDAQSMDRVGPFEPGLVSSGDREWGQRARRAGVCPIYGEDATIHHPARTSVSELLCKSRRLHRGELQLRGLNGASLGARGLARLLTPPLRSTWVYSRRVADYGTENRLRYSAVAMAMHYSRGYEELRYRMLGERADAR